MTLRAGCERAAAAVEEMRHDGAVRIAAPAHVDVHGQRDLTADFVGRGADKRRIARRAANADHRARPGRETGKSESSIDPKSHSDPALADLIHARRNGSASGSDALAGRLTWLPAAANTFGPT